jgi:hypothetical protein
MGASALPFRGFEVGVLVPDLGFRVQGLDYWVGVLVPD